MAIHDSKVRLALRLITKHGRQVRFIELAPGADALHPWEGAADPRLAPARSVLAMACQVEPDSLQRLGGTTKLEELVQISDNIMLVAGNQPLEHYNEVLDNGRYFKISGMELLEPGITKILYFVGVNR